MLGLQFAENVSRPDKNNIIDIYLSDECEDVLGDDVWKQYFAVRPEPFTKEEQRAYLSKIGGVSLGSDAFFPFSDNIERCAQERRQLYRAAGRFRARRPRHRGVRQVRHGHGVHRYAPVPSLIEKAPRGRCFQAYSRFFLYMQSTLSDIIQF